MAVKKTFQKIEFLYTNVGRGHPFYLDGIVEVLARRVTSGLKWNTRDVFSVSGIGGRFGWKLARYLYREGSSGGMIGYIYNRIRKGHDYNKRSLLLKIMGAGIRKHYTIQSDPLIVAHPSLVGILAGRPELIYQHGELIAPAQAMVRGATLVIVPTDEVASLYEKSGYNRDQIFVSGLCVEPGMVTQADDAFMLRQARYRNGERLTGAFFSSGAEPSIHCEQLAKAAAEVAVGGGRAIVFATQNGRLEKMSKALFKERGIEIKEIESGQMLSEIAGENCIVSYENRDLESKAVARFFPEFDYFVAPSHERSNWAIGLGLPLFIVGPPVGPFAPLNSELLIKAGVAEMLGVEFGAKLRACQHRGELEKLSSRGWGEYRINGFEQIADYLGKRYLA